MDVSSKNIHKYKSKKSFKSNKISFRSSLSKKSKKILRGNDSDLISLPKISKRESVLDDKSLGIISLNTNATLFPHKIDESTRSTFQGFQKLDIIIVGLQTDKRLSGSVKFMENLLPNHVLISNIYLEGTGHHGYKYMFSGIRMLVFLYFTETSLKSNIKTIKLCDNSACPSYKLCCRRGLNAINFFDEFVIINSHLYRGVHKLQYKKSFDKRVCVMEKLFQKLKKEFKWDDIQNKKIIWFGDLNFSVSPKEEKDEKFLDLINEIMETGGSKLTKIPDGLKLPLNDSFNIEKYIQNDELKKLLEGKYKNETLKCIFPLDLYESDINFHPSCQLVKGSENIYRLTAQHPILNWIFIWKNVKTLLPSWCDRILFNDNVRQNYDVEYNSYKFPIKSDHKSVYAIFTPKKKDIQ